VRDIVDASSKRDIGEAKAFECYLLIKDFQNNTFAIPNRLTPRMVNLKLIARW
jgi:hypothetical protein